MDLVVVEMETVLLPVALNLSKVNQVPLTLAEAVVDLERLHPLPIDPPEVTEVRGLLSCDTSWTPPPLLAPAKLSHPMAPP